MKCASVEGQRHVRLGDRLVGMVADPARAAHEQHREGVTAAIIAASCPAPLASGGGLPRPPPRRRMSAR